MKEREKHRHPPSEQLKEQPCSHDCPLLTPPQRLKPALPGQGEPPVPHTAPPRLSEATFVRKLLFEMCKTILTQHLPSPAEERGHFLSDSHDTNADVLLF